jgi:hypothetical protein
MKLLQVVFKIVFVIVVLWLCVWCMQEIFYAAQGPDPSFKLDDNHYLMGWPGFLVQYHTDGSSDVVQWQDKDGGLHSPSGISELAVSERYLVAKAEEGWLAIDRKTLKVWVPYPTLADLENAIGSKFGNLAFTEGIPWSLRVVHWPWTVWIITTLIFAGILIGGPWLITILFRRWKPQ